VHADWDAHWEGSALGVAGTAGPLKLPAQKRPVCLTGFNQIAKLMYKWQDCRLEVEWKVAGIVQKGLWYLKMGLENERRSYDRRNADWKTTDERRQVERRRPPQRSPREHDQHEVNLDA